MEPAIVSLGPLPIGERLGLLAGEFGWSFVHVPAAWQIQQACKSCDVVAILFEPRAIAASWQEALKIVRDAAPRALLVVCRRFCESLPWPELAEAGAFHEVWLPFDLREVRQSWGFVQSERLRRRPQAIPIRSKPDRRTHLVA